MIPAIAPPNTKEARIVAALKAATGPASPQEWGDRLGASPQYVRNVAYIHDCSENIRQPPQNRVAGVVRVNRGWKGRPTDESHIRLGVTFLRAAGMVSADQVRVTVEGGRIIIESEGSL